MRIYTIDTELTDKENKDILRRLTEDEKKILSNLDLKLSIDLVDSENKISSVLICNIINLEKLKTFFTMKGINFEIDDITKVTSEKDEDKISEALESITEEEIFQKFGINS